MLFLSDCGVSESESGTERGRHAIERGYLVVERGRDLGDGDGYESTETPFDRRSSFAWVISCDREKTGRGGQLAMSGSDEGGQTARAGHAARDDILCDREPSKTSLIVVGEVTHTTECKCKDRAGREEGCVELTIMSSRYASGQSRNVTSPHPSEPSEYAPNVTSKTQGSCPHPSDEVCQSGFKVTKRKDQSWGRTTGRISSDVFVASNGTGATPNNASK
jgi:hypothetical protein